MYSRGLSESDLARLLKCLKVGSMKLESSSDVDCLEARRSANRSLISCNWPSMTVHLQWPEGCIPCSFPQL